MVVLVPRKLWKLRGLEKMGCYPFKLEWEELLQTRREGLLL